MEDYTSDYYKKLLNLRPHIEGGYFNESFSSRDKIIIKNQQDALEERLKSDEMWYFHAGNPLTVYVITPNGELVIKRLGLELDKGDEPQVLVPSGHIFGSAMNYEGFSLVGCMVSPGFDFNDFEIFRRDELIRKYPKHEAIITKLTRN